MDIKNYKFNFSGIKSWEHLTYLENLGKKPPGSKNHKILQNYIIENTKKYSDELMINNFQIELFNREISCKNITGYFKGTPEKNSSTKKFESILIGSHYDTRWIADNEFEPEKRNEPIPGINDGGSGTAVMLELAEI